MLTGRTLPSVPPPQHPPSPCRLGSGSQAKRQSQALPPSQGASGRLGAPSSSRGLPALTPVVLYDLATVEGRAGQVGWGQIVTTLGAHKGNRVGVWGHRRAGSSSRG